MGHFNSFPSTLNKSPLYDINERESWSQDVLEYYCQLDLVSTIHVAKFSALLQYLALFASTDGVLHSAVDWLEWRAF